jgi:hypothetical protein
MLETVSPCQTFYTGELVQLRRTPDSCALVAMVSAVETERSLTLIDGSAGPVELAWANHNQANTRSVEPPNSLCSDFSILPFSCTAC